MKTKSNLIICTWCGCEHDCTAVMTQTLNTDLRNRAIVLVLGRWVRCLWIVGGSEVVKEGYIFIFHKRKSKVMTDIKKKTPKKQKQKYGIQKYKYECQKKELKKILVPLRRKILWWETEIQTEKIRQIDRSINRQIIE